MSQVIYMCLTIMDTNNVYIILQQLDIISKVV